MDTLFIIFICTFVSGAMAIGFTLLLGAHLFKKMEQNFPKYYKNLGSPTTFPASGIMPKPGDYMRSMTGSLFVVSLVFRGLPKKFPDDIDLSDFAIYTRVAYTIALILFLLTGVLLLIVSNFSGI